MFKKCIVLIKVKKMAIRRSKSGKGGGRGRVLEGCGVGTVWSAECGVGGKRDWGVYVYRGGAKNEEEEEEEGERDKREKKAAR